jgi:hypothetical protein
MVTFNIDSIWNYAFGSSIQTADVTIPKAQYKKLHGITGGKFYGTDSQGIEHFMPVEIDGVILPFALVDITEKKIIVSTALVERQGAVNELVSTEDYQFNIKAILMADDYPEAQVIGWHKIFQKDQSLTLRSVKTDVFLKREDKVIIKEIRWPSVPGVEHVQPVEMTLISDLVYTLEI